MIQLNTLQHFSGRQKKISEYYKRQEKLLKDFNELDAFNELGILPGNLTEVNFVFHVHFSFEEKHNNNNNIKDCDAKFNHMCFSGGREAARKE